MCLLNKYRARDKQVIKLYRDGLYHPMIGEFGDGSD